MNYCTKCGTKLSPTFKYCSVCGCSVSTPSDQDSIVNCGDIHNGDQHQPQQTSGTDRITIENSNGKLILALLGCLVFVVGGFFILSVDSGLKGTVVSLLTIFFFGGVGLFILCGSRPRMVLDSEGFTVPMKNQVVVRWSEVSGYRVHAFLNSKFLVVILKNPEEVARRMGGSEIVWRANMEMYGSPLAITSSTLSVNFDELVALFARYFRKYGINR